MRKSSDEYYKNRHSCFLLQYHMVLATKYLSHTTFIRAIHAFKDSPKKLCYIASTNIDQTLSDMAGFFRTNISKREDNDYA